MRGLKGPIGLRFGVAKRRPGLMPPLLIGADSSLDHHKGDTFVVVSFVSIYNILAAKSGPGVTDRDFRFGCLLFVSICNS